MWWGYVYRLSIFECDKMIIYNRENIFSKNLELYHIFKHIFDIYPLFYFGEYVGNENLDWAYSEKVLFLTTIHRQFNKFEQENNSVQHQNTNYNYNSNTNCMFPLRKVLLRPILLLMSGKLLQQLQHFALISPFFLEAS